MIYLHIKNRKGLNPIKHPGKHFPSVFKKEWFLDPITIDIAKAIDRSDYVGNGLFRYHFNQIVDPTKFSNRAKTLIMLMLSEEDAIYCTSLFYDTCWEWLSEHQNDKDFYLFADSEIP